MSVTGKLATFASTGATFAAAGIVLILVLLLGTAGRFIFFGRRARITFIVGVLYFSLSGTGRDWLRGIVVGLRQQALKFFELSLDFIFVQAFLELFDGSAIRHLYPLVLKAGVVGSVHLGHFQFACVRKVRLGLVLGHAIACTASAVVTG